MSGILIALILIRVGVTVGYWKLFEKAGIDGWKSLIPFYSEYLVIVNIVGKPSWWIIYLVLPVIGSFAWLVLLFNLLRCFGKETLMGQILLIFAGPIYLPYLGFNKSVSYLGKLKDIPEEKKTPIQEWADAIVFAVVAATLIRWLIMEAYTIPTPSMENSMLVGDFLFVSKFHYGTRTPRTPIQMPLTHQKIWFTNIPSYADWIQLPSYRLPGFTHVKRNDVVVFNVPRIEENNYGNYNTNTWIDYPVDLKTNYIKRCVAEAGDVLEIRNRQLIINGTPFENPEGLRFQYLVESTNDINVRNIERLGLDGDDYSNAGRSNPDKPDAVYYTMFLTEKQKELVKAESYIKSVELYEGGEAPRFPFSKYTARWTGNNYGPLTIPKEGMKIAINDSTLSIYGTTIKDYDGNEDVEIKEGKLTIAGKEVTEYTFNQNYYFMMGDNRDNSLDSRYWGFVPEDHVVGKGFFIWLSIDKYGSFLDKIRWNRFFKPVK